MNGPRHLRSRRVATPDGIAPRDLRIENGEITALVEHGSLEEPVLDVGDAVIFPGLIDAHVHVNSPGRTHWEGFATATRAAAAGGLGALFDMPLNSRPVTVDPDAVGAKRKTAAGACRIDVGLYGGLVPANATARAMAPLLDAGIWAVKAFLCPSGLSDFPAVAPEQLARVMPLIAEAGLPLLVHAEIEDGRRLEPGCRDYDDYLASRPQSFEVEAIERLIELCRGSGCRVHIVHLAAAAALPALRAAKREGLPITVETCPHYLLLCAEEVAAGDTRFKCAPPIREAANRDQLWQALIDGTIDFVASDHSPCPPARKALSSGDFARAWGGISSLQLLLPLLWTAARSRGASLDDLRRWSSTNPARLLGLESSRGEIAAGRRADLVVWSPEAQFVVENGRLEHRHPITPYGGRELFGVVERTLRAGDEIFVDGTQRGRACGEVLLRPSRGPTR